MTSYKSQVGEGKYSIQLDTDKHWVYRAVEQHIRSCMDVERLYGDGLIGTKGDVLIFDEGSDNE